MVPITWEKSAHNEQTIYKYTNGEKIAVNDGNTFIQICPMDAKIDIKAPTEPAVKQESEVNETT